MYIELQWEKIKNNLAIPLIINLTPTLSLFSCKMLILIILLLCERMRAYRWPENVRIYLHEIYWHTCHNICSGKFYYSHSLVQITMVTFRKQLCCCHSHKFYHKPHAKSRFFVGIHELSFYVGVSIKKPQ